MKSETNGFSFILKPSTIKDGGVGIFAVHGIAKDTYLELFLPDFQEVVYSESEVPKELQGYCLDQEGGKLLCPKLFNRMDIGNYLNHSVEKQNVRYVKGKGYFAMRDIAAGEELFGNYQELGEPKDTWERFYTKSE